MCYDPYIYILEGTARYAVLLLAAAEGFGLRMRIFFALQEKPKVFTLFELILRHFSCSVVTSANFSSNLRNFKNNSKNQKKNLKNPKQNFKKFQHIQKLKKKTQTIKKILKNPKKNPRKTLKIKKKNWRKKCQVKVSKNTFFLKNLKFVKKKKMLFSWYPTRALQSTPFQNPGGVV